MRVRRFALLIPLLACVAACQSASYFPTDEGLTWEYVVTEEPTPDTNMPAGEPMRAIMTETVLEPRTIGNRRVASVMGNMGNAYWFVFYAADKEGVQVVARQDPDEDTPTMLPEPSYAVKLPLAQGRFWSELTKTGSPADPITVNMRSTVDTLDEPVTVPAGSYRSAARITSTGTGTLSGENIGGPGKLSIEEISWLVQGVGLVKQIRYEQWPGDTERRTRWRLELRSFKKE